MSTDLRLNAQDRRALEDFLARVRTAPGDGILALKLFGSKATGRDDPDSDIDVLVVVNETSVEVENRVIDITFDVNLEHDVYISPMVVARGPSSASASTPWGARLLMTSGASCSGGRRVVLRKPASPTTIEEPAPWLS